MTIRAVKSGDLGTFNVGLSGAVNQIIPLASLVDGLLSAGVGPYLAELLSKLNSISASATALSVQVKNPLSTLKSMLSSLLARQAALTAALALPSVGLGQLTSQLANLVAIKGSLGLQVGALQLLIPQVTKSKAAALGLASSLRAKLSAGPVFIVSFDGTLGSVGSELSSRFSSGLSADGNTIQAGEQVYGVVLLTASSSVKTALSAIIST